MNLQNNDKIETNKFFFLFFFLTPRCVVLQCEFLGSDISKQETENISDRWKFKNASSRPELSFGKFSYLEDDS